ncbi:MAG: universal stress protein [Halodesulfurarchaeum sp.]
MFERILLPVDGSPESDRAIRWAMTLASASDAVVHALYVIDRGGVPEGIDAMNDSDRIEADLRTVAESVVETVAEAGREAGVRVTETITAAHPIEAILSSVPESDADLIVIGTHSPGRLDRFLHRSLGEQVAQHAPVPVLTVYTASSDRESDIERILLATDGRLSSENARTCAFDLAGVFDAVVIAVYVLESRFGTSSAIKEYLEQQGNEVMQSVRFHAAKEDVDVRTLEREGEADSEILSVAESEDVDLVVLGTHGRTGLDRVLMGSVACRVIRNADRPVLTVPMGPAD